MPSTGSSSAASGAPQKELVVASFKRLNLLGKGTFALVYKAVHTKHGTFAAIKSVHLAKLGTKVRANLSTEINILKSLDHPHIVSLFDCRESPSSIHLVMEFCPLGDLAHFIKNRVALSRSQNFLGMFTKYPCPPAGALHEVLVRHFVQQLVSALEFMRNKDFIHRDLKPQNLLISPSPLIYSKYTDIARPYVPSGKIPDPITGVASLPMLKIADFGFARSLPSSSMAETLCGSPLYMAPEILRYEKYDSKADLWSVGTVTYEMIIGTTPYRAANHVELLRKIEVANNRVEFPTGPKVSDDLKNFIRSLLKKSPMDRMSFADVFQHVIVVGDIPGLAPEDRKRAIEPTKVPSPLAVDQDVVPLRSPASREPITRTPAIDVPIERRPSQQQRHQSRGHPVLTSSTAPAGQLAQAMNTPLSAQTPPELRDDAYREGTIRTRHQASPSTARPDYERGSVTPLQPQRKVTEDHQLARERAAQDVADEREYVVVEKKAVEINAFADEVAAAPRQINRRIGSDQGTPRRYTVASGTTPPSGYGNSNRQVSVLPSRAETPRQVSYGGSLQSKSSAIANAISQASGRLFNLGLSPPLTPGKISPAPPLFNAFPVYPARASLLLDDGKKDSPKDEDSRVLLQIEEAATRSDVVYGFAEVKYKQIVPLAPSIDPSTGPSVGVTDDDLGDLPADILVTISEEALVLYVKALSLLARSMDLAGAWWSRRHTEDEYNRSALPPSAQITSRMNAVVQWVRTRFNEVLEKAEFVRLKLIDAQRRLPSEHPSHPDNHHRQTASSSIGASSSEHVFISPGISAEKLMYQRAVEMSRSAAVNELVHEDLPGCELSYMTAVRMLEAVLEHDRAVTRSRSASAASGAIGDTEDADFDPMNPEDRDSVVRMIEGIKKRINSLRKKISEMRRRSSLAPSPQGVAVPGTGNGNGKLTLTPPGTAISIVGSAPR